MSKQNFKNGRKTNVDEEIRSTNSRKSSKSRSTRSRKSGSSSEYADKSKGKSQFLCSEGEPTNDPRWYINNPYLSRDVGSIWFSRPTGGLLAKAAIPDVGLGTVVTRDQYDPGILAIPSIITWGGTSRIPAAPAGASPNAVINLTAQKLYQFVVHANSRNISYDKKDLMMSLMAIDAVYCLITEAIRAYRMIANFDPQNKYLNMMLKAMNWDADDLKSRVAEFRYTINYAISRVNKLFMPALFDVVKSHYAAYEHIYADRPSNKAQYYVKYSAGLWMYNDTEGTLEYTCYFRHYAGTIVHVNWSTNHTVDDFKYAVDEMLSRIENAQYLGVMQGDLLKAFGFEHMSQYAYVGIDMPITPVYDEEFLYKLHNAHLGYSFITISDSDFWVHQTSDYKAGMIYRDDDTVTGNFRVLHGKMTTRDANNNANFERLWTRAGTMIDLPSHIDATPENILLMTLYKMDYEEKVSAKWYLSDASNTPGIYSSELMPEILMKGLIYCDPDNPSNAESIYSFNQSLRNISYLSRFAVTPLITQEGVASDTDVEPFFWHTDNVTVMSYEQFRRTADVIWWSLWSSSEISSSNEVRDGRI